MSKSNWLIRARRVKSERDEQLDGKGSVQHVKNLPGFLIDEVTSRNNKALI